MFHCFSGLLRWLVRRCCRRSVKAAVASVEVNGRQYRVIRNFNGQFMLRTGLDYDLANDKVDIEQPGRFSCWGFANKDYARTECTEETASPDLSEDGMSEELSQEGGPQPRTIFHALHLTFDDIRRILPELAWKGFDAIQIPPAQVSPNGDLRRDWYLRYQPVNYQHIDLRLGGAESLQRLCEEASGHGMTVIADCVFNHMAVVASCAEWQEAQHNGHKMEELQQRLDRTFGPHLDRHDFQWPWVCLEGEKWDDPHYMFEGWGCGEWSELRFSEKVIAQHLQHLRMLLNCGVTGFRLDAAKHMRPEHVARYVDFIHGEGAFVYAEVLSMDKHLHAQYEKLGRGVPSTDFLLAADLAKAWRAEDAGSISAQLQACEHLGSSSIQFVRNHDTMLNDGSICAPPPGPYVGFQPSSQPIGFEMHQPGYPPPNSGPGYPMNPPAQDIYRATTNEFASYAKPATPSYHHHGDENADNLPPVGFEGIPSHQDPDTATASGVRLLENSSESPVPPVYPQPSDDDSHRVRMPRDQEKTKCSDTLFFKDGKRRIDYILAYEIDTAKDREWQQKREEKRASFEANLEKENLELEAEGIETSSNGKTAYIKIHAPWRVLTRGAEEMLMKMPIKENDLDTRDWTERCFDTIGVRNPFELRIEDLPEQPNYFTCAFRRDKLDKFLIPENRDDFFTSGQRSRIVHRILTRTQYGEKRSQIGIGRLINNGTYTAAYPLHEGPYEIDQSNDPPRPENARQLLFDTWVKPSRWYKMQPLDHIRDYFGEKIGIYFAWLGFYTAMLLPAAIMGLVCVIYGLVKLGSYIPVKDICDETKNFPMCPRCDGGCPYWHLSDTCIYSKVAYVFDNEFTVVFAIFMSLWATMFLEFWKRRQAEIAYEWDLLGYEDEEEQPRPEYEAAALETRLNPITKVEEPFIAIGKKVPRFVCSISFIVFMLLLVIIAVFAVVVYRAAVYAVLAAQHDYSMGAVSIATSGTAALINLIIIMLLNKVYEKLAELLTRWEMPRTQTELEDIFSFKMYLFQFVNFYSSLFYIAFFKLNPGRPAEFNRIFGEFRQEECNPAGCLFELLVQLAVIMVGKQIFNNFIEVIVPKLQNWWRRRQNIETPDLTEYTRWELDYDLTKYPVHGLFYEYLEMVIQYGFVTLFVAAFPLGPFFALINNLMEIRLDAYKFIVVFQRPMAARAQDIGIWYTILKAVTKISVVVNGFVIAFVSEFVPRLYYTLGEDNDSLEGFVNSTLSCFVVTEFPSGERPSGTDADILFSNGSCGFGLPTCRFRGYYERPLITIGNQTLPNPKAYKFSTAYWHILAAKLFFVVAFLHIVFGMTAILAWIIPDVPKEVENQVKRENFLAREALRSADQYDSASPVPPEDDSRR